MAAYRRVYDSRHLQTDCQAPGSAPEPYARQSSRVRAGYLYLFNVCCDTAPNGDVSGDAASTSPRRRSDADDDDDDGDELAGARSRRRRHNVSSNNNWKTNDEDDTDDEPRDTYKYQRRRSRAVLYQLSGSYGAQRSAKGKLQQLSKVRDGAARQPGCFWL